MGKLKGVYKMNGVKNHQLGVELNDHDTIGRALVQLHRESPKFIGEVCHKYCKDLQVGASGTINTKDMGLDSHKWEVAGSHSVGEGMMSGAKLHFSGKQADIELNKVQLFALINSLKDHNQSWSSESTWDLQKGSLSSKLGVLYKGDGYQTRMKVDDQGAIRGQLKWNIHPTTSCVLHSESHINNFISESATVPKIGMAFEVKL